MVDMTPVASSNVAQIGYDEEAKELYVEFHNGSTYKYLDVPPAKYDSLKHAPSVGSYLNKQIKNVFACEKVA